MFIYRDIMISSFKINFKTTFFSFLKSQLQQKNPTKKPKTYPACVLHVFACYCVLLSVRCYLLRPAAAANIRLFTRSPVRRSRRVGFFISLYFLNFGVSDFHLHALMNFHCESVGVSFFHNNSIPWTAFLLHSRSVRNVWINSWLIPRSSNYKKSSVTAHFQFILW